MPAISRRLALAVVAVLVVGCGSDDPEPTAQSPSTTDDANTTSTSPPQTVSDVVDIGGGRSLYYECSGGGSPTILLEGGDEPQISQWRQVVPDLARATRTCVYERGGTGRSSDVSGCRGLDDLLDDVEALLEVADLAGPYVLVGTSYGGFLTAGLAARRPAEVAGLVLAETPKAMTARLGPPETACEGNPEHTDNFAVENDAWAARAPIGDFPMTVITNDYGANAEPGEQQTNVVDQQGWLILSSNSKQVLVTSGHNLTGNEPEVIVREVLAVLDAARSR
jgi:hypothetical protein